MLRRWWVSKYRLPATSPLFTSQSFADLLLERYEDLYVEAAEIGAALGAATNSSETQGLQDRLADIARALREPLEVDTGDELLDEWERDIAAGRTPNLMKGWVPPAGTKKEGG